MRYFVLIPDGAAEKITKDTALSLARTPYLDLISPRSMIGLARTIPAGLPPGSDVGTLSVFGFDPFLYAKGRAPLEIAAKKIQIPDDAIVFRMNLVYVEDGVMKDHSARHIGDAEAEKAIENIKRTFSSFLRKNHMEIYFGKSYRNYLVWDLKDRIRQKVILSTEFAPPHDIVEQKVSEHISAYKQVVPELFEIMEHSADVLRGTSANMVWFWGQGKKIRLPRFNEVYGKNGYLVSAVDIIKGIAVLSGLEVVEVPGITGYLDSNFEGKVDGIVSRVKDGEVGFIHVEATDETGHEGDREKKKYAIELFDTRVLGHLIQKLKGQDFRLLVIPDHQTPCDERVHVGGPVPFLIYPCPSCEGRGCSLCGVRRFTEIEAYSSRIFFDAKFIMRFFLSRGRG